MSAVRGTRGLIAAACAIALAAGCSPGSSAKPTSPTSVPPTTTAASAAAEFASQPLAAVLAATKSAASGRINGTINDGNGAPQGDLQGAWSGDLAGRGTVRAEFTTGRGVKVPTELRSLEESLYFERAVASVERTDPLAVFTRSTRFPPWRTLSLKEGVIVGVPSAFSPPALIEWFQRTQTGVTIHPGERIGSKPVTRLTSRQAISVGIWNAATVDMWVDEQYRVVRVRIASPSGGARYDVERFGSSVDVTKPPASEISTESEMVAAQPEGDFASVVGGETNGVTWSLERTPGTRGATCWQWKATPPLSRADTTDQQARCVNRADDPREPQFVAYGNGTGSYDALAVVLPDGVKSLTLGFVGGTTEPLEPSSPLVWVGPSSPTKAYLGLTFEDGTTIDCGAGAVSSVGDLTDPNLTERPTGAAWGCLPSD